MNEYNRIKFCDLHCDTAMELLAGAKLSGRSTQINIDYMQQAQIAFQLFACYVPSSIPPKHRTATVFKMLSKLHDEIEKNSDVLTVCYSAKDAQLLVDSDKIGAVLTIENGIAIENDLKTLEKFYNAGIRCMTICHARSHDWAISSNDRSPQFDGLTRFGERVIRAMNEMGMLIDLSHAHDRTVERVLAITNKPVLATHSCVEAICRSPRNLKDDLIRKLADNGGMIGINFYPGFLDRYYAKTVDSRAGNLFAELTKMEHEAGKDIVEISRLFGKFRNNLKHIMQDVRIPISRIVDHVEYLVKLVGDDFIGFGSDFDGIPDFPQGMEDCRGYRLLLDEMVNRGFSYQAIDKIACKNFLRIFSQ